MSNLLLYLMPILVFMLIFYVCFNCDIEKESCKTDTCQKCQNFIFYFKNIQTKLVRASVIEREYFCAVHYCVYMQACTMQPIHPKYNGKVTKYFFYKNSFAAKIWSAYLKPATTSNSNQQEIIRKQFLPYFNITNTVIYFIHKK